METEQKTLKTHTITFMIVVAIFYDILEPLLDAVGIGWILSGIAYLHFWLWFRLHGVKFFRAKRAKSLALGAFLELFSAGILPAFTFNVAIVALDYKVKKNLPLAKAADSSTPRVKKAA